MALSENDTNLIERYFEGSFDENELLLFKEKEKQSPDFAQEVDLQRTMIVAIRQEERRTLKEELKKEIKNINLTSSNARNLKWPYAVAAAVSLFLIITYLILPSSSSLFEAYYSPFPENPITRSEPGNTSNYGLAMQQYSIGDYQKALDAFLKMSDSSIQDEIALYKGNCFLNLDEPNEAIVSFQTAIKSDNNQIVVHAQWFLALTFIMNNDKHKARELLLEISRGESHYSDKASVLLKKLQWTFY